MKSNGVGLLRTPRDLRQCPDVSPLRPAMFLEHRLCLARGLSSAVHLETFPIVA